MKQYFFLLASCFFCASALSQLKVQNAALFYLSGDAKVTLKDISLVNDGTITVAANGRFVFTGSSDMQISGSQLIAFNELEIANSVVKKLILQRAIDVNGKIIFTSGIIDLNNNNINLGVAAFLENESETSRVIGANGGQIIFSNTLNAPISANPANLGAIISSSQNLGIVTIRRGHQVQVNSWGGGNSIFRYYEIIPQNNVALNATLRFRYFDTELNSLAENNLTLWKSANNINWALQGFSTRDPASNYVEKTAINDFSRWTLSTPDNALPITGLTLSGRWKDNGSWLSWTTLAEYDNNYFDVERKYSNEDNFKKIGIKYSVYPDGNSQSPTAYSWTDATAVSNRGDIQYRLKQVDRNSQFTYSNIILIKPGGPIVFIEKIYPTFAVKNNLYIQTGNSNIKEIEIQVYDMQGRSYLNKRTEYRSQWIQLPELSQGIYRIVIRSGEWRWAESFYHGVDK